MSEQNEKMLVFKLIRNLKPEWDLPGIEILHISEDFNYKNSMKLVVFLYWGKQYKLYFNNDRFYIKDMINNLVAEWDSRKEFELYQDNKLITTGLFKSMEEAEEALGIEYISGTHKIKEKATGKEKVIKGEGN